MSRSVTLDGTLRDGVVFGEDSYCRIPLAPSCDKGGGMPATPSSTRKPASNSTFTSSALDLNSSRPSSA